MTTVQFGTLSFNNQTGRWERVIPLPYYHSLPKWLWLRLTGYRDTYGRKAKLFLPWQ